jgi:hypothetical protein
LGIKYFQLGIFSEWKYYSMQSEKCKSAWKGARAATASRPYAPIKDAVGLYSLRDCAKITIDFRATA